MSVLTPWLLCSNLLLLVFGTRSGMARSDKASHLSHMIKLFTHCWLVHLSCALSLKLWTVMCHSLTHSFTHYFIRKSTQIGSVWNLTELPWRCLSANDSNKTSIDRIHYLNNTSVFIVVVIIVVGVCYICRLWWLYFKFCLPACLSTMFDCIIANVSSSTNNIKLLVKHLCSFNKCDI